MTILNDFVIFGPTQRQKAMSKVNITVFNPCPAEPGYILPLQTV